MTKSYEKWKKKGFQILAVPCNQFGDKEPGKEKDIFDFVSQSFNSKFPLLEKMEVNGNNTHPLYAYLRSNSELYDPKTKKSRVVHWNFSKFFIDSKGKVIKYFPTEYPIESVAQFIDEKMSRKEIIESEL